MHARVFEAEPYSWGITYGRSPKFFQRMAFPATILDPSNANQEIGSRLQIAAMHTEHQQ
jgi:hypothetical protein